MTGAASGDLWAEFWSGEHAIYVNARHAQVHYERISADLAALLSSRAQSRVLDWGCGDALSAPAVAAACGELLLYDAVPAVRARVQRRFADVTGLHVLDDAGWAALGPASIDVAILNSVAQYLGRDEIARVLDAFRRILRPDGELIVADVIPPDAGMLPDILSLLKSGWRHGFFLAACGGLARTFFSEYRKIRARAGFAMYSEADMLGLLAARGFRAERLAANVGFNQQRMTFRARPGSAERPPSGP